MSDRSVPPAARYVVGEPRAYETGTSAAPSAEKRVAAILVHGMGQQIEFETLDLFERGLREQERLSSSSPVATARFVRLGEQRLRRLELPMTASDGSKREVHLYEAYWAPMTEGKVTLRDVSRLLWRASSIKPWGIDRWLFGKMQHERPSKGTVFYVDLAFLTVVSFLILYTVTALALGLALLSGEASSWIADPTVVDLLWPALALIALVLLLAGSLWAARSLKRRGAGSLRQSIERALDAAVVLTLILLALAMLLSVLWGIVVLLGHRAFGGQAILPDPFGDLAETPHFMAAGALWAVFLVGGWKVREILVQYLGDVAAYVSPNALDRFAELRRDIQSYVYSVASSVFRALGEDGHLLYGSVVIAGHSLGSVIAYDTLNRLVNEDALLRAPNGVLGRTSLLLTFGSPLDKTAYIFARQGEVTADAREALVAAVQPLVQTYANRAFPWINLYSRYDPVSDALRLYDEPAKPAPPGVENLEDPDAVAPLLAHIDYWRNPLLFKILYRALGK